MNEDKPIHPFTPESVELMRARFPLALVAAVDNPATDLAHISTNNCFDFDCGLRLVIARHHVAGTEIMTAIGVEMKDRPMQTFPEMLAHMVIHALDIVDRDAVPIQAKQLSEGGVPVVIFLIEPKDYTSIT